MSEQPQPVHVQDQVESRVGVGKQDGCQSGRHGHITVWAEEQDTVDGHPAHHEEEQDQEEGGLRSTLSFPVFMTRITCFRWGLNIPLHQEVVGDGAKFLVADDRQTNQEVAYDGQHSNDELSGYIKPIKQGLVSVRLLCRAATRSYIHDEREIPKSWKTWE